jgi:hypothetical protein
MENWFDIVEPHEDIKKGDFDEAVFAAKLDEVLAGTAPPDYNDPYEFFKKTYFTEGITDLLKKVHRKLSEGKGSGVIEIQTPFGGGKTHALVAIYHYLRNGKKVKALIPEGLELIKGKMAVIVGTTLNPLEGRKVEGLEVKTLWGDIAYQLAGKRGYKEFDKNDAEKIAPGKEKLKKFLQKQEPFILLFDETLEYIIRAQGVHYRDTNLATQTYAFLQELSETVTSIDSGMMIVTLPSSAIEDPSEKPGEALRRLEKIFGRVESIETPVKGEEVYSIIARRLFQRPLDPGKKDRVIHEYFSLYQDNKKELPQKARDVDLKRKMELSYPFHPDVIDILYEKWGTYASFQRTRGVLRLLANVVEDLYRRERNIDMILPSDLNMENPAIRREFLRHIGNEYESVIGSDIAGHEAKAQAMDSENKSWKHLAERISTAVFFHSFSADASQRGIDLPYIKLAVLHHDTVPPMVTEVLQKLSSTLWYLNEKNGRYFFSRIPNLNRMILDKKELYSEAYEEELREIVRRESGKAFVTYIWEKKSEDVPDNQDIKLVILHPDFKEGDVDSWFDKRGNSFRIYKNTLIFAFSEPSAFAALREQIKTYLALKEIREEIESGKNEPLREKLPEVKERMKKIDRDLSYNLRRMYHILQVGDEVIDLGQPGVGKETLSGWYRGELEYREKLVNNLHYRFIIDRFLTNKKVSTKTVLEQFYKDKRMVMLSSKDVLKGVIRQGVADGAFGLAYVKNDAIVEDTFKFNSNISTGEITFDENEHIVSKDACVEYKQTLAIEGVEEVLPGESEGKEWTGGEAPEGKGKLPMGVQRYKRVSLKVADIPSTKIADLNRGVLMPISQEIGDFKLKIELDISDDEGISKSTIEDKVKETIRQIGGKIVEEDLE